jgi:carbamoylphosphate synthase large subunit
VVLALPAPAALAAALDKGATLRAAARLGIPVPGGITVTYGSEAAAAGALVGLPAVVKPSSSWQQSAGVSRRLVCALARTSAELQAAVDDALSLGGTALV